MTTKYRERLDPALIRPGRVDVEIEFGYASKETIRRVFRRSIKNYMTSQSHKNTTPQKSPYEDVDSIFKFTIEP